MALQGAVLLAFKHQAEACRRLGSPFTAHLCERLAAILDPNTALGRAVGNWPLNPDTSALALRLCGVLNMAAWAGHAPALARLYPPDWDTSFAFDVALQAAIIKRGRALVPLLESAPQTNEVARSAVILGGLLTIAAETGLPIALHEIGSSAGLNLYPDRYGYDLGQGRRWRPRDPPLTIACEWDGAIPPLDAPLIILSRAGSDLAPIDASDADARDRLLAYIWPDQPTRLERTAADLAHAAVHPVELADAEAADWVAGRMQETPVAGIARVLMHSIVWQYFPKTTPDRIKITMTEVGADATADTPLAWLRLEPDGEPETAAILLTNWPGARTRMLGRGDYHGRFANWKSA